MVKISNGSFQFKKSELNLKEAKNKINKGKNKKRNNTDLSENSKIKQKIN